jgi:hypothetical protein
LKRPAFRAGSLSLRRHIIIGAFTENFRRKNAPAVFPSIRAFTLNRR